MNRATNPYAGYRYPAEIISHAVWLYFRFTLSFRDIEELLAARGLCVTYETIRQWCLKFGQPFANEVRRRLPRPGDKWHLDEMYRYCWRIQAGGKFFLETSVKTDQCGIKISLDLLNTPEGGMKMALI